MDDYNPLLNYERYLRYIQVLESIDMVESNCDTALLENTISKNGKSKKSDEDVEESDSNESSDDREDCDGTDSDEDSDSLNFKYTCEPSKKVDLDNPYRGLKDGENPLETMTDSDFLDSYKFTKKTVCDVMELIKNGLIKNTNRGSPVPPLMELLITLKYLTTGSVQKKAMSGVSQSTISRINTRVTKLIVALKDQFIRFPDKEETEKNMVLFYERGKFPNVVGCVVSAHVGVRIKVSRDNNDEFINENGYHSYRVQIHQLMLRDEERMRCYKLAIMNNQSHFDGKTVMDVGAGSGILSVFCAMAGAKKVYAVEASDVASLAKSVIKENKYDHIIEVLHCKVEDITLPSDEKVDVIVSEWMGFYLLHEGMLDSVLYARDKFLKPAGLLYPESATVYMTPCSVPSMYGFWENVHGVRMTSIGAALRTNKTKKPEVLKVEERDLLAEKTALCWIDLKDVTVSDLDDFSTKCVVGTVKEGAYQGMCLWFDCQFPVPNPDGAHEPIILSTGPDCPETHWKQTVIVLPEEQILDKGEPIAWELSMRRSESNGRRYDLQLTLLDPAEETHPMPCSCHMTKCIVLKSYLEKYPDGKEPFGEIKVYDEESDSEYESESGDDKN